MKLNAPKPAGFTLVELLVAMGILAIILVGTVQITGIAQGSVRWAEKKIASDSGARQLTALLERDLREMIRRPDAPFEFQLQPGNDSLAFLATRAGYARGDASADRSASLVRYDTDPDGRFTRACLGFGFEGEDTVPLDPAAALPDIPDENRQVVSDTVFRVEFEFLVDDAGDRQSHVRGSAPRAAARRRDGGGRHRPRRAGRDGEQRRGCHARNDQGSPRAERRSEYRRWEGGTRTRRWWWWVQSRREARSGE